jgi:hypothetical protein
MQRIGYFSTRGYWHAPLAVFIGIVVGGVALPLGQSLGIGLIGFGVACSLIIAFVLSIQATQNQNIVEMMHEVDSSLQLVDYSFNFLGNSRLKMNSARGGWQIDIPTKSSAPWVRFRGPNELDQVIGPGPGFTAEVREMMRSVGCVSAGAQAAEVAEPSPKGKAWRGWLWIGCGAALLCWTVWRAIQ